MLCHADGVKGEAASGSNRKGESTEAERRGGAAHSSEEGPVMGPERRGCVVQPWPSANWKRDEPVDKAKPFKIPKREVWEAFKHVKANQGAAGVDGQSIAELTGLSPKTPRGHAGLENAYHSIHRRDLLQIRCRFSDKRSPTQSVIMAFRGNHG